MTSGEHELKLSDIGEFSLIERISSLLSCRCDDVICGIGDDAAVLNGGDGKALLVTVDSLVENIHFTLRTHTPYQLGYKAMAVNLSDIAAMGGEPKYTLVSISARPDLKIGFIEEIYRGLERMAREAGVSIVGGDTTGSPTHLFISISVIGECPEEEVIYRSGAKIGDMVILTGTVGDSAAGLALLSGSEAPSLSQEEIEYLRMRHLMPRPRLRAARKIASLKLANAMIDVSDGVSSEVNHICQSSRVGAEIYAERIPISEAACKFASDIGVSPLKLALNGGEDYELLLTAPEENVKEIRSALMELNLDISVIGRILPYDRGCTLKSGEGEFELEQAGFTHFLPPSKGGS
ncbi:thiamine-phosphate kinase [Candidatus Poribacteria bacterium]|nr:thiamine-phosphate kinase [Candidatus Poribacteria bacterium]